MIKNIWIYFPIKYNLFPIKFGKKLNLFAFQVNYLNSIESYTKNIETKALPLLVLGVEHSFKYAWGKL